MLHAAACFSNYCCSWRWCSMKVVNFRSDFHNWIFSSWWLDFQIWLTQSCAWFLVFPPIHRFAGQLRDFRGLVRGSAFSWCNAGSCPTHSKSSCCINCFIWFEAVGCCVVFVWDDRELLELSAAQPLLHCLWAILPLPFTAKALLVRGDSCENSLTADAHCELMLMIQLVHVINWCCYNHWSCKSFFTKAPFVSGGCCCPLQLLLVTFCWCFFGESAIGCCLLLLLSLWKLSSYATLFFLGFLWLSAGRNSGY